VYNVVCNGVCDVVWAEVCYEIHDVLKGVDCQAVNYVEYIIVYNIKWKLSKWCSV
jgi:hypothetical protein